MKWRLGSQVLHDVVTNLITGDCDTTCLPIACNHFQAMHVQSLPGMLIGFVYVLKSIVPCLYQLAACG